MKTKLNIICYLSMCLLGIYLSVYQNAINSISVNYCINSTAIGFIISLHFIGSLTAPVVFGEISDRIGKKAVAVISYGIMVLGLITVFLSKGILATAAGIFLVGCGFAVIEGVLTSVLADENIGDTNRVINISQMFFCIGAVAGPIVSLFSEKTSGSWKTIFLLLIFLFAILLTSFSSLRLRGTSNQVEKGGELISFKLFKEKIFIALCISMFIYVGIEEGTAFWLNTYFKSLNSAGHLGNYALSGYWASMVIGRYCASKFNSKNKVFLKGGLLISLMFILVPLIWRNDFAGFFGFFAVGLGFSAVWPVLMSITADKYPGYTGTAMGIMMTAGAGGGIVIPFLMGVVANYTVISTAFRIIPFSIILILALQVKVLK